MCVSQEHSIIITLQHCDDIIKEQYSSISESGEGKSDLYAHMTSDRIVVNSCGERGWNVTFDKEPTMVQSPFIWQTYSDLYVNLDIEKRYSSS